MKAVLTGHTRGLGAAIAEELLSRRIAVLALSRGRRDDLAERFPGLLEQVELDLSDSAALAAWVEGGALQHFAGSGEGLLLVNNAGLLQPVGPMGAQDPAQVGRTVAVNVAAPLMLAGALTATGTAERRILHVSSGAARNAYPGWSVYCATKAALDHHARAAVLDQVPGMRISSVAPGVVDTDMQAQIRAASIGNFPLREKFVALKRQGQLASPRETARKLVDYLLSDQYGQVPVTDLRELDPA